MNRAGLLLEAQQPETSPERLLWLATEKDREVRRLARANPRFPAAHRAALDLADSVPGLLDPLQLNLLARLGPWAARIAARHDQTTDDTLVELVLAGYAQQVLLFQPKRRTPWLLEQARHRPALLTFLCEGRRVPWPLRHAAQRLRQSGVSGAHAAPAPSGEEQDPVARLRATLLDRTTGPFLSAEDIALIQGNRRLQSLAARHPFFPLALLQWLDGQQPDGQARETILRQLEHLALASKLLTGYAEHGTWEERAAVARNPHLPGDSLDRLTRDEDWWVRAASAENPNATPEALERLAGDPEHVTVRECVAAHPHTPGPVLVVLAQDGEPTVRAAVARNPSTPPEALDRLSCDTKFGTREAVAAHALTSPDTLQVLAQDANERVRLVARTRSGALNEAQVQAALATRRRNVKLALGLTPAPPPSLLVTLAHDRHPRVRAQTAWNPHLPTELLKTLTADPELEVRRVASALNPDTPADQLAFLPRYDARVRQALSRNLSAPAPVLEELSDDALLDVRLGVVLNVSAPGGALERRLPEQPLRPDIRRHPRYAGRVQRKLHELELHEAEQPDASPDSLQALSQSDAVKVRRAVAIHAHSSTETLLGLAADDNEKIRLAVVSREAELAVSVQQLLAADRSEDVRLRLVRRLDLHLDVLLMIARNIDEGETVLTEVAQHPAVTPDALGMLAVHRFWRVRQIVARHPATPLPTLLALAQDPQEEVLKGILRNPMCTPAVMHRMVHQPKMRLELAHHSLADHTVLEALAFDGQYERFLRVHSWTKRLPPRISSAPLLDRWRAWSRQQASRRAAKDLHVLIAVIEHPAASPKAVQFARRLDHVEIHAAVERRQLTLQAGREEPHD
ncbi:hypothetical protein [Deinococcus arcticus]|uniref:Leucine rich repeat variant n=1 Tax=Deinococcus arcticus TaxID=2136176 RepID=A0A2T3W9X0_9DEIO|nr:hypothetical protein [Deinococcus arcticus]PTA68594.1 hypothetical protein C8263_07320 [Deinococcus arcticus]